ncbi:MAG: helix-turn-helix transcriptional regulator [Clostridia bacterium]|nr:helix-turn-helix transcriptional regulator [Clostridia bacterium]
MRQRKHMGNRNLIGPNIAKIRQAKSFGQGELVRLIQATGYSINQAKLSRIEGRKVSVTDKDILAIAQALNVNIDELFVHHHTQQ